MGAGASVAIDKPFSVDAKTDNDITLLSEVAAQLLSSAELFDVRNLARPGVCGDYVVAVREKLDKALQMISVDGEKVAYIHPRQTIKDPAKRKKICRSLATASVRAIATVLAAIGSIQVAGESRQLAVQRILKDQKPLIQKGGQRGGGQIDVLNWLANNGYISRADVAAGKTRGIVMTISDPTVPSAKFLLSITPSTAQSTMGTLTEQNPARATAGSLNIEFMDPHTISGTTQQLLPVRIYDRTGVAWMVGVLYGSLFKSLNPAFGEVVPFTMIYNLFERAHNPRVATTLPGGFEDQTKVQEANRIFLTAKSIRDMRYIEQPIASWLSAKVPGFTATAAVPTATGPYGFPPGGPYAPPPYGAYPPPAFPGAPAPVYGGYPPLTPAGAAAPFARPIALVSGAAVPTGVEYDIPFSASRTILQQLQSFKEILAERSCPAAVRATTLSAQVNRDRTVTTNVCKDPMWTSPNLSRIFGFSTFQFLSIRDWDTLAPEQRASVQFHSEWSDFLSGLEKIYQAPPGGAPPTNIKLPYLERTAGSNFLDQIKFRDTNRIEACNRPIVRYQQVQSALLQIQGAYQRHVERVWTILNSLILVIEDPETKGMIVRFHPKVAQGDSLTYVDARAKECREALRDHYLEIERLYTKAVESLQAA